MADDAIEIFVKDEKYVLALWRCVYINVWKRNIDAAHVRQLLVSSQEVARMCPAGFVSLAVMEPGGYKIEGADSRAELSKVSKLRPPNLLAVAQVIESTGFAGATVRALLTGINVIIAKTAPTRVFDDVAHASPWLAEFTGKVDAGANALGVIGAVTRARA